MPRTPLDDVLPILKCCTVFIILDNSKKISWSRITLSSLGALFVAFRNFKTQETGLEVQLKKISVLYVGVKDFAWSIVPGCHIHM